LGFVTGTNFQKSQRMKVKEKSQIRMIRVIKKKTFYSHYRTNNFSYHHRSPEVHSITLFNVGSRFVSQGTPSPIKDKPTRFNDKFSLFSK
jgi:uncharacterized protein YjlB